MRNLDQNTLAADGFVHVAARHGIDLSQLCENDGAVTLPASRSGSEITGRAAFGPVRSVERPAALRPSRSFATSEVFARKRASVQVAAGAENAENAHTLDPADKLYAALSRCNSKSAANVSRRPTQSDCPGNERRQIHRLRRIGAGDEERVLEKIDLDVIAVRVKGVQSVLFARASWRKARTAPDVS